MKKDHIKSKRLMNVEKVMFLITFSVCELTFIKALPANLRFNTEHMCQHILNDFTGNDIISVTGITQRKLIVHFDSAKTHTAAKMGGKKSRIFNVLNSINLITSQIYRILNSFSLDILNPNLLTMKVGRSMS